MDAEIAGWIASLLTVSAAAMTAANLGPRITGWGFVIFTLGSLAWIGVATMTDAQSQLFTHMFLTVVNVIGVWRWLGREASYEEGGSNAARQSDKANVPSLFSSIGLAGSKVTGNDNDQIGTVIDTMLRCDRAEIAYVVIGDGGLGGIGESLRAVDPSRLEFKPEGIVAQFGRDEFLAMPPIGDGAWPQSVQAVSSG